MLNWDHGSRSRCNFEIAYSSVFAISVFFFLSLSQELCFECLRQMQAITTFADDRPIWAVCAAADNSVARETATSDGVADLLTGQMGTACSALGPDDSVMKFKARGRRRGESTRKKGRTT